MAKEETVLSLHKAVDILFLLQQEGELGVTEISRALGMNKSTVHRILTTLEKRNLICQSNSTGKYWFGLKLYSLGMTIRENLPIQSIAAPYLRALSDEFNETVHLSVLDISLGGYPKLMIIDKTQSSQILSLTPSLGSGKPCHCSAMGKCLLAFSSEEDIQKFTKHKLLRYTKKTITDWNELIHQLYTIREDGYAIDDQETEIGLTCVGSPILNKRGEVLAAISLSGPTSRITDDIPEIIEAVKRTARNISDNIG